MRIIKIAPLPRLHGIMVGALVAVIPALVLAQATAPTLEISTYGMVDEAIKSRWQQTFGEVFRFYGQEFGASPVSVVRLHLFENANLFARWLIEVRRWPENLARQDAELYGATTPDENILIDASRRFNIDNYASHEFMHVMQRGWIRGTWPRGANWLAEGMATVYSARFQERKGTLNFVRKKQEAIDSVKPHWQGLAAERLTGIDWAGATRLYGSGPTGWFTVYAYAFLAYDYLETRFSRAAVVAFWTGIRPNVSAEAAFHAAFGVTIDDFERDLKAYIPTILGSP